MNRTIRMGVAGVGAFSLAVALPVSSALAQSGDPVITNTETVNVATDSSGDVESASVYDQIAIQGSGDVEYENPVSTAGLRNLDSFAGFAVEDGAIVEATTVDGQVRRRTISDFDLDLPVEIAVVYKLDGEEIDSGDLVGKTGELEVTYIVENMTGEPQEISFTDGEGNEITETQTVYEPMAGSLTFTLPSNFTDVQSESGAVIAGDGRGGTKMTFSVTLIPPLGSPVAEVSYTAGVTDATIPPANLSMIPVVISNNPTASGALESFQGGAETGAELAAGAAVIDENLLALADGASTLLSGLILLRDGSADLSGGLVDTAAPGATLIADGLGQLQAQVPALSAGVIQLDDGANDLEAGLRQLQSNVPALTSGVDQLDDGAQQVADGVAKLDAGLDDLYAGVEALPATVKAGLENNPDYNKLLDGLDQIIAGLRYPGPTDCDVALAGGDPDACGAMDAVELVSDLLAVGADDLDAKLKPLAQGLYFGAFGTPPCGPPPAIAPPGTNPPTNYCDAVSSLYYGLFAPAGAPGFPIGGLQPQAAGASAALEAVYMTVDAQLIPGLDQVKAGIPALVDAILAQIETTLLTVIGVPSPGCDPTATLRCASAALESGSADVAAGASRLNASVGPLAAGVDDLAAGATTLSDGLSQLRSNVDPLAAGVDQLADGADQLAGGLGDAADGSVVLASGLEDAAEAAPALPEGAQRLSEEGSSELIKAGNDTAVTFGQQVAVLEAGAERTADGGLPYGAPEDALRFAAYSYDIAGAAGTTSQNTGRLLWALVIGGGAAAGAAVLAQRRAA